MRGYPGVDTKIRIKGCSQRKMGEDNRLERAPRQRGFEGRHQVDTQLCAHVASSAPVGLGTGPPLELC